MFNGATVNIPAIWQKFAPLLSNPLTKTQKGTGKIKLTDLTGQYRLIPYCAKILSFLIIATMKSIDTDPLDLVGLCHG